MNKRPDLCEEAPMQTQTPPESAVDTVNPSGPPPSAAVVPGTAGSEPISIGGWLVVMAIGMIANPVRYLTQAIALIQQSAFSPSINYFILFLNLIGFGLMALSALFFFRKRKILPGLLSASFLSLLALSFIVFVWGLVIFDDLTPLSRADVVVRFLANTLFCAVWVPYLKYSRRVKRTFVLPLDPKSIVDATIGRLIEALLGSLRLLAKVGLAILLVTALFVTAGYLLYYRTEIGPEAYLSAARTGDVEKISFARLLGASPNQRSGSGETPLIIALNQGELEVARILLSEGALPEGATKEGVTALHAAVGNKVSTRLHGRVQLNHWEPAGHTSAEDEKAIAERAEIEAQLLKLGAEVDSQDQQGRTALHVAITQAALVKPLLEAGANVNLQDQKGRAALHEAPSGEICRLLTAKGADVNLADKAGKRPLHDSADEGVVTCLMEKGAEINATDKQGRTALFYARSKAHVAALIASGIDVNAVDAQRSTAVRLAFKGYKNEEVVEELIKQGAGTPEAEGDQEALVNLAAKAKMHSVVRLLLHREKKVLQREGDTTSLLAELVKDSQTDLVSLALDKGAEPGFRPGKGHGALPLWLALTDAKVPLLTALLQHGAQAKKRYGRNEWTYALHEAVAADQFEVVKTLIRFGTHPNVLDRFGKAPLFEARSKQMIDTLLDAGANLAIRGRHVGTPLQYFAKKGNTALVEALLDRGANVNQGDQFGFTPLILAARSGEDLVKLLLRRRADPNAKNHVGETALHLATTYENLKVMAALLASGAKTEAKDRNSGYTPLHKTAIHNKVKAAELLLQAGAEVNCRDRSGRTPLDIAAGGYQSSRTAPLIELLEKHGGKRFGK